MTDLTKDFPEHRGFNIPSVTQLKRDIFVLEYQVKKLKQALINEGWSEEQIEILLD